MHTIKPMPPNSRALVHAAFKAVFAVLATKACGAPSSSVHAFPFLAAQPPLHIPSVYTASFTTDWLRGWGDGLPTGWRSAGSVHVEHGQASFSVSTFKAGEPKVTLTYTQGLLFTGRFCVEISQGNAWGVVRLPDLASLNTSSLAAQALPAPTPAVDDMLPFCEGSLYTLHAFGADVTLCTSSGAPHWVHNPFFHTVFTLWEQGGEHISPPERADMSACSTFRRLAPVASTDAGVSPASSDSGVGYDKPQHSGISWIPWSEGSSEPGQSVRRKLAAEVRRSRQRRLAGIAPKHVCFMHGMGGMAVSTPGFPAPFRLDASQDAPQAANSPGGESSMAGFAAMIGMDPAYAHFIRLDTITRGWNNKRLPSGEIVPSTELQDAFYEFIRYYRCDVVFAHSMGNLVLAALAGRGKPVRWYSVGGPFRGTVPLNYISVVCKGITALVNVAQFGQECKNPWLCRDMSSGFCYASADSASVCLPSPAEFSMIPQPDWCKGIACWRVNNQTYSARTEADASKYERNILGRMCGTSPFGTGGFTGVGLAFIASIIPYSSPNDGLVEFTSCAATAHYDAKAGFSFNNPFSTLYAPVANHREIWTSAPDASTPDRMPQVWIKAMIERGSGGTCPIAGYCAQPGELIF